MIASTDHISSASPRLAAVIVAAGGSRRMGGGLEKQYRQLGSSSVLAMSVSAFLKHPATGQVVIVTAPDRREAAEGALGELHSDPRVVIVDGGGGMRRQDDGVVDLDEGDWSEKNSGTSGGSTRRLRGQTLKASAACRFASRSRATSSIRAFTRGSLFLQKAASCRTMSWYALFA